MGRLAINWIDDDRESLNHCWPYRTTPLVLPGAKVKKDPSDTVSYLRHHPNPSFRAHPSQYDTTAEVLMKHKVADSVLQRVVGEETANKQVVHKQFNSPIGLYSELNIAETIQSQTGVTPSYPLHDYASPLLLPVSGGYKLHSPLGKTDSLRKTVTYDPAKSETFKALQEDELGDSIQEVTVPVQHKVFAPNKPVAGQSVLIKKPALSQQVNYLNALGGSEETIHQSGSFKRLMNAVLGESEF
uniref:(California timema) hypothetical protein n=1 Tax=Timema californicum TaxID=61474 RepID=A0A7R9JD19_TIMCA|nr:unnamed protein product [Timema californicum]